MLLLVVASGGLIWSISLVFIPCELCGWLSNSFVEINDTIDQFNWYSFPLEIRNRLPILMNNTQQIVYIECFGSLPTDRETFKKVSAILLVCRL